MPITDTFIIPPVNATTEIKTESGKPKKKSGKGKWAILIGLVILIITLPVGVYYFSQQKSIADTRSRATGECKESDPDECQSNNGNTGYLCSCKNIGGGLFWRCDTKDLAACPLPESGGGTGGGGTREKEGTDNGCDYISNKVLAREANVIGSGCTTTNCGGNCDNFKYNCGVFCYDLACGAPACDEHVAQEKGAVEPTVAPTSAPATPGKCDASCTSDSNCESGLSCSSVNGINSCRNAACPAKSNCECTSPTDVPAAPTNVPSAGQADVSGQEMPVSGIGPGILGSVTVIGSILLLVVGLVL